MAGLVLVLAAVAMIPFGTVKWPAYPGFIWAYVFCFVLVDGLTCVLLLRLSSARRSGSVEALSAAYLFTALMAVLFFLTFPGTLTDGVLVGGSQSAVWAYYLWRIGFAVFVILSSSMALTDGSAESRMGTRGWLTLAVALAGACTAAVVAGTAWLPVLLDPSRPTTLTPAFYLVSGTALVVMVTAGVVTALAARRRRSQLQVWLTLVCVIGALDIFVQMWANGRYAAAWYTPRVLSVVGTSLILIQLVSHASRSTRRLSGSLEREHQVWEMIQHAEDGLLLVDEDGDISWSNSQAADLLGYPQLSGVAISQLVPQEHRVSHDSLMRGFFTGEPEGRERRMAVNRSITALDATGRSIPVDISLSLVTVGSDRFVAVNIRDAAERVLNEQMVAELSSRTANLTQAVDEASIGYAVLDHELRLLDVNGVLCEMSGYSRLELLGSHMTLLQEEDADPIARENVEKILHGDASKFSLRTRMRRRNSDLLWIDAVVYPMVDAQGMITALAATVVDITAQVAAEASDQAPIGIAATDAAGRLGHANSAFARICGLERTNLLGRNLADLIHPADRKLLAHDRDQLDARDAFDVKELRLAPRPGDDKPRWVQLHRGVVRDRHGDVSGLTVQVIDLTAQKAAEAEAAEVRADLAYRSTHDVLTGLLNRAALTGQLEQWLTTTTPDTSVAILFVDLDHFKQINDTLSHSNGDETLRQVSRVLLRACGASGVVARLGGDEFVIARAEVGSAGEVEALADRVRATLAGGTFGTPDRPVALTASIGVSLSRPGHSAETLMQEADIAMYRAKQLGRNRVQLFDDAIRSDLLLRMEVAQRIRAGLLRQEFHVWLQPIVHLATGTTLGFEGLCRWVPDDPSVAVEAGSFITVAEETGLIVDLGGQMVDQAISFLSRLPAPLTIAVNASPVQLMSEDFAGRVATTVESSGADPRRLVVELTEQSLLGGGSAPKNLERLAAMGVGIHVDDFGTGYSSLTHLRDFPVTGIKLDRSFTTNLADGDRSRELAAGLASLARRLGMVTIAEGIEQPAQRKALRDLGWDQGQGWLFGRAQPPDSAVAALSSRQSAIPHQAEPASLDEEGSRPS